MSRQVEAIEVLRRDDVPAHFLWHSRLYMVRDVVARWTEFEPWPPAALDRPKVEPRAEATSGDEGGASGGGGGGVTARATAPASAPLVRRRTNVDLDAVEHQIWRVRASRGRLGPTDEYELRRTWPGGGWSLVRERSG